MVLTGGSLATPSLTRQSLPLTAAVLAGLLVAGGVLLLGGPIGAQAARVVAAGAGLALVLHGWQGAAGRTRRVRGWIALASGIWLASEVARLIGMVTGERAVIAELSVVGLALAACGTYGAAARGRMRSADESALYLDAVAVVCAVTGGVIVAFARLPADALGIAILMHAALFGALVAAAVLLDLATRVPLRLPGPWEIVIGLGLGAVGYLGLLTTLDAGPLRPVLHGAVAVAALMVGHGAAHWTDAVAESRRYDAVAGWLRRVIPLVAGAMTAVLIVVLVVQPDVIDLWLRAVVGAAFAAVVVTALVRQTILLADRERVLDRARQLTDELTVAEAQYRSVVERVPGVLYLAEPGQHGRWHFVSPKIQEMLGYTADEWVADPTLWMRRLHPADRDRILLTEASSDRADPRSRWEYRLIARDGRVVWVIDDEAVITRDGDGRATMVQGILIDISERKELEDQLRHQALHDSLTGLPNRVLLVDRLSHALVRRQTGDDGVAVLFLDLDDFKDINDTLGHAAGDELLALVADRLGNVLRAEDTVARLGGDEFAFLLEGAGRRQAEHVADRILSALGDRFDLHGRIVTLSASIGIATRSQFVSASAAMEAADELIRDADTAMYVAKSRGKGQVQVFWRGMEEPVARRRELRNALERAIDTDQLFLEYQPIVDMRDGALLGVESLARWNHPQLGRLLPNEFIPLAESAALIDRLGAWVMRQSCRDVAPRGTLVSVNVSAHQLSSDGLSRLIGEVLSDTRLAPERLLLELTESTLASAGAGAEAELVRIRELGVRIALDDFGSGYNSLEYLGRLPIDVLKIDMSLVQRVHLEPQRQEVVRAIGHIADKLGLEIIVEGVELEEQRAVLVELGFVQAQGFLFAAALPLDDALAPRHLPLREARAS